MTTSTLDRVQVAAGRNIASRAHKANPHPFYARLRDEAPVCEVPLSRRHTAWLITRYDDVAAALKNDLFVKDRFRALNPSQVKKQPWIPAFARPLLNNMLDKDPPDHTRLRALVQKAFTPRLVEQMRPRIERLADELLAPRLKQRQFDLVADFALPIPTTVIAELLGVPPGDRQKFHRWSSNVVASSASAWAMARAVPSLWLFLRYIRSLVQRRRHDPGDDLTSALVAVEEQGERLNEDELVAMLFLILVAGHETTVNLVSNGMLALIEHPDQHALLRERPELTKSAVEEMLRFDGPLETATERYTRASVDVAGTVIPQGELVFAALASANRDPRQFDRADEFDITREPNRHLSFGLGMHYCLGAPLARLEAQLAVASLMRVTCDIRLAVERQHLRWRRGLVLRGLEALPVEITG
jgi:cytochrome P450